MHGKRPLLGGLHGQKSPGLGGWDKRRFEQSGCGARPTALCSCAHKCATKHTALRALHNKSCRCCFFMRWESPVSAGGPQTPHIPGPEGRFCTPPGAPSPAQRRHRKNGLNGAQVGGRPVDGILQVVRGPGQDFQDAVQRCFRLFPAQADG